MTQDDELDEELHRLFRDDRLDVPPREGAESAILAGARRVRRRRTALAATGGTLTVVVLIGAGLFFGGLRSGNTHTAAPAVQPALSDSGSAPAATPIPLNPPIGSPPTDTTVGSEAESSAPLSTERTTASRATSTTTSQRADSVPVSGPVLGPSGYSKLQLGMTFDDAKATGLLAGADTAPTGCADYTLSEGTAGVHKVTISGSNGIVSFEAAGAHTPERIKVGSTKDQLEAAYPTLTKGGSGYSVSTGAGGTYVFAVDNSNKVSDLTLVAPTPC